LSLRSDERFGASSRETNARIFAEASILKRKDPMIAVTYGGARTPNTAVVESLQNELHKGFFARFMAALRVTRREQARRVIERYAALLSSNDS
jgi:hypothetical protein